MLKIIKEVKRIKELQKQIGKDLFVNESKYKNELEILILGYYANLLKLSELTYPIYFEKRNNNNPPDFNIHDSNKNFIKYIEVTECLKPKRRRQQEYRNKEIQGKWEYNPENLISLLDRLNNKFLSKYTNTDLIIYLDINIFHLSSVGFWHSLLQHYLDKWVSEDKLDWKMCSYESVFVVDSNGERLLKIFPEFILIYTPDSIEKTL